MDHNTDIEVLVASADKKASVAVIKGLNSLGFSKISHLDDGIALVKLFSEKQIDFLVIDQNVQHIPGWMLIKEIKVSETIPNIPVVLFGREDPPAEEEELKQYGIVKYIQFPATVSEISFTINSTLTLFHTSGTVENKYSVAKEALINDDLEKATDMYSELRSLTKKSTRSSLGLAQTHIKNANHEAAYEIMQEVADSGDLTPAALMVAIRLDLEKSKNDDARQKVAQLLEKMEDAFYYSEIVKMLMKYKDLEYAAELSDQAIEKGFKLPEFYQCPARLKYDSGQFSESLEIISKAEAIFGSVDTLLNLKGVCLKRIGRYDEAIAVYEEALRISPSDAKVYFNLALCAIDTEQFQQAAQYLESCLKISPGFSRAKDKLDELREKRAV